MYSSIVLTGLAVALVNAQAAAYGQCGGSGWTGATTCIAGWVCTYSNDWYSQCLQGTAVTTTTTKATTSITSKSTTTTSKTSTSTAAAATAKPTFYIAGDSTAAVDGGTAYIGWGTQVGNYLTIPVVNNAIAGRSSRSFTVEGRFASMLTNVKSGDIVIIEFGHNDGGGLANTGRGVCPGTDLTTTCTDTDGSIIYTFFRYMEDAVNAFKAKGAKVIVSSQTPNNPYDVTGTPSYVGYAKTVASQTGVTYVDHFNYVLKEYTILGETVVNGLFPVDHTHTNVQGADYVAQALIRGVICGGSSNPLYSYVKTTSVVPPTCL